MKKKAFLGDMMLYAVILLVFGIFFVTMFMALSKTNEGFQSSNITQESKDIVNTYTSKFKGVYDNFTVTILIGVVITMIITAFILRNHPVFAGIAILVMILIVGVTFYLSNFWHSFAASDGVSTYAEQFTLTTIILNNLPKFIVVLIVIFIVILFSKSKSQSLY